MIGGEWGAGDSQKDLGSVRSCVLSLQERNFAKGSITESVIRAALREYSRGVPLIIMFSVRVFGDTSLGIWYKARHSPFTQGAGGDERNA